MMKKAIPVMVFALFLSTTGLMSVEDLVLDDDEINIDDIEVVDVVLDNEEVFVEEDEVDDVVLDDEEITGEEGEIADAIIEEVMPELVDDNQLPEVSEEDIALSSSEKFQLLMTRVKAHILEHQVKYGIGAGFAGGVLTTLILGRLLGGSEPATP